MLSIIGFIVILIPLVVVHELGHFLFAKLFNVRADAFSIGFGPVLFHRKMGETDFRISAIPLGGYVKLHGEDPTVEMSEEEKKRALHHQAPWKRFFIFFGGPLFNFLWAIVVFMIMMAIGEPQAASVVGRVLQDSPAQKSGFLAGDKIIAVDGEPVTKFEEVAQKLSDKPNLEVTFKVERAAGETKTAPTDIKITTASEEGFSIYGEKKQIGTVDGIVANPRSAKLGISNPESLAAKAGVKTGDEITAINGQKVETFEQVERIEKGATGPLVFSIKQEDGTLVNLAVQANELQTAGLNSSELFVDVAMKDSPAQKAGVMKGDRLASVNGKAIRSFYELRLEIQKAGEEKGKVNLGVERAGKILTFDIVPQTTTERDPLLKKTKQYTVGVQPVQTMMDAVMITERVWNPFVLVGRATARMIDLSARNLISIGKMVQGQVSVKSLGGPILIGKLAGDSLSRGIIDFLKMMAILSIGLGVLNILPIPVLDGGHIVLLGIEAIRGKALSLKQVEVAQQVGLVLIMLIMIVVMKNDISRLPIFN